MGKLQKLLSEFISQEDKLPLSEFFRLFSQFMGRDHRRRSHSRCKRSPEALEKMFFDKKCKKLSKVYGGEP